MLSKPLMLLTGACVALAAILSKPNLGSMVSGILHPVLPTDTTFYSPWLVIMGVLAATMGSISSIRYSATVLEKGWRSTAFLRQQRIDLVLSLIGMFAIFALMQIAAAGALQPRGIQVKRLEDIAPIFGSVFGNGGILLFGATLWCVTFSSATATDSAYGIMLSDVYYRFIKPSRQFIEERLPASSMPAYRWVIAYSFLSPLYVLVTDWSAVSLLYVVLGINLLTVPVVALMILRLTADRKIMGAYVNHWFTNLVLALAVVCALFLSGKGLLDLLNGS
jgi:Mn2+/Fe2+ NRAMP family transporter